MICIIFSSCHILKNNKISPPKNTDALIMYAEIKTNFGPFKNTKLKTKITFSYDTIIASIYPVLGIELAKVVITPNHLVIQNKYSNTKKSINLSESGTKLNPRKLQRAITQFNHRADTTLYNDGRFEATFTDYTPLQINTPKRQIFLPKTIYFENKPTQLNQQIEIDYKSIKFQAIKK